MRLSPAAIDEMRYIASGGTVVFPLYVRPLKRAGFITVKGMGRGRYPYCCDLTDAGREFLKSR